MVLKGRLLVPLMIVIVLLSSSIIGETGISTNQVFYENVKIESFTSGLSHEKIERIMEDGWVDLHVIKMDTKNINVTMDLLTSDVTGKISELVKNNTEILVGLSGNAPVEDSNSKCFFIKTTTGEYQILSDINGLANLKFSVKGSQILREGVLVEPTNGLEMKNKTGRTAIGISSNGQIVAVIVDGRSRGMNYEELAAYLKNIGVTEAMLLQGNQQSLALKTLGETKEVLAQTLIETSSIQNAIGFVRTAPMGKVVKLEIRPSITKVGVNVPIQIDVIGYDINNNAKKMDYRDLVWQKQGFTVSGNTFIPNIAGKATITCYYGELSATYNFMIEDQFIDLQIEPQVLYLEPGTKGVFNAYGTNKNGSPCLLNTTSYTWKVMDSTVATFTDGSFVAANKSGTTRVILQAGGVEKSAYVVVGKETKTLDSFENTQVFTYNNLIEIQSSAMLSTTQVKEGNKSIQLNYFFNASPYTQSVSVDFNDIIIKQPIDTLGVQVYGDQSGLKLTGTLRDALNRPYDVMFTGQIDFNGWKQLEVAMPKDMMYPVRLEQVNVSVEGLPGDLLGVIYLDQVTQRADYQSEQFNFSMNGWNKADPLLKSRPETGDYIISVFGTTVNDRLLNTLVAKKAQESMAKANFSVFAGLQNTTKTQTGSTLVWSNTFSVSDDPNMRIITLATNRGGITATDPTQWAKLNEALAKSTQKNILVLGTISPILKGSFSDSREAALIQTILSTYQQISGKNVYYINASGRYTDVTYLEGVRYIDLNGVNTPEIGNQLDLNNSFYTIEFYIQNQRLNYNIKNLYPKIVIGE